MHFSLQANVIYKQIAASTTALVGESIMIEKSKIPRWLHIESKKKVRMESEPQEIATEDWISHTGTETKLNYKQDYEKYQVMQRTQTKKESYLKSFSVKGVFLKDILSIKLPVLGFIWTYWSHCTASLHTTLQEPSSFSLKCSTQQYTN